VAATNFAPSSGIRPTPTHHGSALPFGPPISPGATQHAPPIAAASEQHFRTVTILSLFFNDLFLKIHNRRTAFACRTPVGPHQPGARARFQGKNR
jgi:hypothetical protein